MQRDTGFWTAAILNAAWHVRNARRELQRDQAVLALGLTVRKAFGASDDFAPLLRAVAEGLVSVRDSRFSL